MNTKQYVATILIALLIINLILFATKRISTFFFWIDILIIFVFTKFYMNKKK